MLGACLAGSRAVTELLCCCVSKRLFLTDMCMENGGAWAKDYYIFDPGGNLKQSIIAGLEKKGVHDKGEKTVTVAFAATFGFNLDEHELLVCFLNGSEGNFLEDC